MSKDAEYCEDECVNEQIDRLNYALQHILTKISARNGPDVVSPQESVASMRPSFFDDESYLVSPQASDTSSDIAPDQDDLVKQFEDLLQHCDRLTMQLEDFRSQQLCEPQTTNITPSQVTELIAKLCALLAGKTSAAKLQLHSKSLDLQLQETTQPHAPTALAAVLRQCLELIFTQHSDPDLQSQFQQCMQELDASLLAKGLPRPPRVNVDSLRQAEQEVQRLKEQLLADARALRSHIQPLLATPVHKKEVSWASVDSEDKDELVSLQQQLQQLQHRASLDKSDTLAVEIERLKTRISTLRTQRVLSKSTRAMSSIGSFSDSQTSLESPSLSQPAFDEQKKNLLELKNQILHISNQQEHTKRFLNSRKLALKQKEEEVARREVQMLRNWNSVPNAADLIQKVQMALVNLDKERRRLERQAELLDVEKLEACSLKEKAEESRKRLQLTLQELKSKKGDLEKEQSEVKRLQEHFKAIVPHIQSIMAA